MEVTRWAKEVASSTYIQMSRREEGLGRIVYVAGALDFERPFLGPFFTNSSRSILGAHFVEYPAYVAFILKYLAHQVERSRHNPCASVLVSSEVAPRVDAQASGDRTGIGGWYPVLGEDGQPDPKKSPWFSLEIRQDQFPWVFEKGRRPSLIISTLEALAVSSGIEGVLQGRRRTAQEEGTGHAHLERQSA